MTTNNKENVMLEEMKREIERVLALWVCIYLNPKRTHYWVGSYLLEEGGIIKDAEVQRSIASFKR
tara:strand:- start:87 stop:281 length:195 start_codon:yes stop_codon:yes gene_type:complete